MNLLEKATKVLSLAEDDEESYAWISASEALLLRPASPRGMLWDKPLVILVTQFMRKYEAFRCDVSTGQIAPLTEFNLTYSSQLIGTPMHMVYLGAEGKEDAPREIKFIPPDAKLSPNGERLLWMTRRGTWTAASLDGRRETTWRSTGSSPHGAIWTPNSRRWIELVSHYEEEQWVIPRAVVHRLDEPGHNREVVIEGLTDGLQVGLTNDKLLILRHPGDR
jgi:hypothetical protein